MSRGSLKLLFVINSNSGKNSLPWEETIRNYFTGKDHSLSFFYLSPNPGQKELKNALAEKPDRVIAVGGDGTISLVAQAVAGKFPMGIIPAGSANGMAKELEIPLDPQEALDIIENGQVSPSDAIRINGEICLHLSDIGFNAQLIKYFDEGGLRGQWGYARVLLKTLWNKRKMQVVIRKNKQEIKREAFMVVLANASKYGTGAVINPTGELDDGEFEVVIVRKLAISEILKMLFLPQPFNPKKIEVIKASSVTISTGHSVHFQVDGEYKGRINGLSASILPRYIDLILPAG